MYFDGMDIMIYFCKGYSKFIRCKTLTRIYLDSTNELNQITKINKTKTQIFSHDINIILRVPKYLP